MRRRNAKSDVTFERRPAVHLRSTVGVYALSGVIGDSHPANVAEARSSSVELTEVFGGDVIIRCDNAEVNSPATTRWLEAEGGHF